MAIRELSPAGQLIYDRAGAPLAYLGHDNVICRLDGASVGYVHRESVWTFPGDPAGWLIEGWLRTLPGYCVGFMSHAIPSSGPSMPIRKHAFQIVRRQNLRGTGVRRNVPLRPGLKKRWSKASLKLLLNWIQLDAGQ